MQQSLQPRVQSRNRPSPLVPERAFSNTNDYEALTVPSRCANWSNKRLVTKLSAPRPKLKDILSSSFLTVLCALSTYFLCSVKAQHICLADHIKQTVNTVLVGQSFTTFQVIASHSKSCKTESSWIVEHEINNEHVFVTTVD